MRVGIDPGVTGAIAMLDDDKQFIAVLDMPTLTLTGKKQQVNAAELGKILWQFKVQHGQPTVYLERVSGWRGEPAGSSFNFGVSYGIILGVVGFLRLPLVIVSPGSWKRRCGLLRKPKDMARTLCQQLYPDASLARKKDIGRADALLIATFGEPDKLL